MPVSAGDKLGPYEILAPLGAGGMGEVYRARDSKLDREVAIKVLPAAVANDPERLARFEREAKALAALNHPNIAHIYGLEESGDTRALVMELVPGANLKGPLPIETALNYARQIAGALDAAHDKGITHRDLKPPNIMITPQGLVKVLDFGLASAPTREGETSTDGHNSPTMTIASTQAGMIMGTAAYMSPEQASGKPVDKRADIWAFGVVLWEMLTGKQLFDGETISHTLAAVLTQQPDFQQVPAKVRRLLRSCLEKDPKRRLRDIGDWEKLLDEPVALGSALSAQRPGSWLPWTVAALLAAGLAVLAFIHFRQHPPIAEFMRFQIPTPDTRETVGLGFSMAISPDGRRVAFTALGENNAALIWVRSLDTLETRPLAGTDGALGLFWSPDSRWIGFAAASQLKRIEATGGPAQKICDLGAPFRGGTWAPDGTIVFATRGRPFMQVGETGGAPVPLAALGAERHETELSTPSFLPDGRHFVYVSFSLVTRQTGIYASSVDAKPNESGKLITTVQYPSPPIYAPAPDPASGYLLFEREGSLMALPFNPGKLESTGAALPIAEGIVFAGPASYSASSTGVLAYRTESSAATDTALLWFDRQGKPVGQIGPRARYNDVQLSPDGKVVVVDYIVNQAYSQLSSAEVSRGIFSRLNPGDVQDYAGDSISPDGRVAFTYALNGALGDIYVKPVSGVGTPEPLVKSLALKHPNHWSLDGRYIIYDEHTIQQQDLWVIPMAGNTPSDRKPIPFLVTPADETDGNFSPDTKWVAYSSNESGRREVYVQGFLPDHVPAAGIGKWRISTAGGAKPRWRRDGKELYYIAPDGKLMAVPVKSMGTMFEPGLAAPLFQTHARGYAPYDVSPDGRFLINTAMEDTSANSSPINIVVNWTAGLRK